MNEITIRLKSNEDCAEFIGQIIENVDDFLKEYDIRLANSELDKRKDQVDSNDVIYGSDYDELKERFMDVLQRWRNAK